MQPPIHDWIVKRHLAYDLSMLEVINERGVIKLEEIDLEMEDRIYERYSYEISDFTSARGEVKARRGFKRGKWNVYTDTRTVLRSNETHFLVHATLDAYEDDLKVYSRTWNVKIERDHV